MLEVSVETITPELATRYLASNVKNRSVRKQEVEAYAREIKRGTFALTHQGIAFDDSGHLIDGQHRLMAIATAGIPVQMVVARGVVPMAFSVIDRGASRTMRDVVSLNVADGGESYAMMRNGVMLSAISQLVSCGYRKMKLTPNEVLKLFDAFGSHTAVAFRCGVNKSINRSQVISAAIAAMQCGVSHETIEKFFKVFNRSDIHNCEGHNAQVVLNWRRQIDDAKIQRAPMNNRKIYLGTQNAIWHFANNTKASRIAGDIRNPRYDVTAVIKSAIDL